MQKQGTKIHLCVIGLCFWQEVYGAVQLIENMREVPRILSYADDLKFVAVFCLAAEVFSNWIVVSEKLTHERLADDRHSLRCGGILFGDATSSDDRSANHLKVARRNSIP